MRVALYAGMDNLIDLSNTFASLSFVDRLIAVGVERGEFPPTSNRRERSKLRLALAEQLVRFERLYAASRPKWRLRRAR